MIGTADDDSFERLGRGNDIVDGKGNYDFLSYRNDGGTSGVVATFGPNGNGTVIDSYGDTDTINSVQGYEGTDLADQFTFLADADFNVQPGRGADRIIISGDIDHGTLDYAFYFDDAVVDFVRTFNLPTIGITLDFSAGTIAEYDGTVDVFSPVRDLEVRGTAINDILKAGDDGFRTTLDGRGGSDLLIAGDEFDVASFRREGRDIASGFNINLVTGKASNGINSDVDTLQNFRWIEGSDFNDTMIGNGQAESFKGGHGNDTIDGGGGTDTAINWNYLRSEFGVSGIGTETVTITHLNGGEDGTDTLTNVEAINFDDGMLRVDIDGNAGQAYRLYQAAFDRTPDQGGLSYWIEEMDKGASLTELAGNFILSDEFEDLYGDPASVSNSVLLTLVYQNILDRAPDSAGFDYWLSELDNGYGRDALLASFSKSDENVDNSSAALANGIFFAFS